MHNASAPTYAAAEAEEQEKKEPLVSGSQVQRHVAKTAYVHGTMTCIVMLMLSCLLLQQIGSQGSLHEQGLQMTSMVMISIRCCTAAQR
jgi:hypothetical protein